MNKILLPRLPFVPQVLGTFIALLSSAMPAAHAATVFSQNFDSSTTLGTYTSSAAPTSSQFNSLTSGGADFAFSIVNNGTGNALQGTRSNTAGGSSGAAVRSTDLLATGQALQYQFNLNVTAITGVTTSTQDIDFEVGGNQTGFTSGSTGAEAASVFGRFFLDLQSTTQYAVAGSGNLGGSSALLAVGTNYLVNFYANKTGAPITFTAPDGSTQTLGVNSETLYFGNTLFINNQLGSTLGGNVGNDITDFKLRFAADFGTVQVDNFNISTIPEPATWAWLTIGSVGVAGAALRRRRALA